MHRVSSLGRPILHPRGEVQAVDVAGPLAAWFRKFNNLSFPWTEFEPTSRLHTVLILELASFWAILRLWELDIVCSSRGGGGPLWLNLKVGDADRRTQLGCLVCSYWRSRRGHGGWKSVRNLP